MHGIFLITNLLAIVKFMLIQLKHYEIEDFLCINKEQLKKLAI